MATGKRNATARPGQVRGRVRGRAIARGRRWPWVLVVAALVAGALWVRYGDMVTGYGRAGTAYGARVACSCRYVEGRTLADCKKDKLAGMELVILSDDDTEKSVTAMFPLVARDTARLRDGYGCVLDPWDG